MLFSSLSFIFGFLPAFLAVYFLTPVKYRNIVLLMGSLVFYGIGEPFYILLLIFSLILNYLLYTAQHSCRTSIREMEERMQRSTSDTRKKYIMRSIASSSKIRTFLFVISIVVDTAILIIFKYWDFFAGNIDLLFQRDVIQKMGLALPLGISFYTFQIISFQIDNYRDPDDEKISFLNFASYVSMFPQLIAGPIVKYSEVGKELKERTISWENIEKGFRLFAFGLALKVLLANQMGSLWNQVLEAGTDSLSAASAWLGAAAYSFQIYFDFWGYSVMAVGLGEMLGFKIPANFNDPYSSKSISDYWRRWHITLGRWFKEYIYIPMGGNRKGFAATVFNTFLVWALTGFWHGADWNFIIWGLVFFVLISLEKIKIGGRTIASRLESTKVLGHLIVIAVIPVTWVIFAQTDLGSMCAYLQNMIGIHYSERITPFAQVLRNLRQYAPLLAICTFFATPYPTRLYKKIETKWYTGIVLLVLFWFSVYEIWRGSSNPFLYFRF